MQCDTYVHVANHARRVRDVICAWDDDDVSIATHHAMSQHATCCCCCPIGGCALPSMHTSPFDRALSMLLLMCVCDVGMEGCKTMQNNSSMITCVSCGWHDEPCSCIEQRRDCITWRWACVISSVHLMWLVFSSAPHIAAQSISATHTRTAHIHTHTHIMSSSSDSDSRRRPSRASKSPPSRTPDKSHDKRTRTSPPHASSDATRTSPSRTHDATSHDATSTSHDDEHYRERQRERDVRREKKRRSGDEKEEDGKR